jgi:AcrR family transcriptional regulator
VSRPTIYRRWTDKLQLVSDALDDGVVRPRLERLERVLHRLGEQGAVRSDVDVPTLASMCLGGFFGAHLRGERDHAAVGDSVAEAVWQLVRLPSAGDGTGAGPAPSGL